jgi:hypothetical protein
MISYNYSFQVFGKIFGWFYFLINDDLCLAEWSMPWIRISLVVDTKAPTDRWWPNSVLWMFLVLYACHCMIIGCESTSQSIFVSHTIDLVFGFVDGLVKRDSIQYFFPCWNYRSPRTPYPCWFSRYWAAGEATYRFSIYRSLTFPDECRLHCEYIRKRLFYSSYHISY